MADRRLPGFGDICQIAYVSDDFDGALGRWVDMGAGPFFVRKGLTLQECFYPGRPVDVAIDLALGYWGSLQIEVIRQTTDAPSTYSEWTRRGKVGVHHLGFATEDVPGAMRACQALGLDIVQETRGADRETFYARAPDEDATMLEVIYLSARRRDYFAMMLQAHRTWDGRDPVRPG